MRTVTPVGRTVGAFFLLALKLKIPPSEFNTGKTVRLAWFPLSPSTPPLYLARTSTHGTSTYSQNYRRRRTEPGRTKVVDGGLSSKQY